LKRIFTAPYLPLYLLYTVLTNEYEPSPKIAPTLYLSSNTLPQFAQSLHGGDAGGLDNPLPSDYMSLISI